MRKFVHLMLVALALSPLTSRQFSFDDQLVGPFGKFSKGERDIASRELYDSISDTLGPQIPLSEETPSTSSFNSGKTNLSSSLNSQRKVKKRARKLGQTIQIQLPDLTTEQLQQLNQLQINNQSSIRDPTPFDRITDAINYIPKQLGVSYTDATDTNVGALGLGALGYGAYNAATRKKTFRKLKKRLVNNFKVRQRYMTSINDQTSQLTMVKTRLGNSVHRVATVQDEVTTAIKSALYSSANEYD